MKAKRILKQNLSTIICAAVLFAPVQPFCHAEGTAATSAASHTVELNIKKSGKPYKGLQFDLYAYVFDKTKEYSISINCGNYDTEKSSSINVDLPESVFEAFSDEERYSISFYVEPTNISAECFFDETDTFKYIGEPSESYDMTIETYGSSTFAGTLKLSPPEKLVYKIGEELDLTGGSTRGAGEILNGLGEPAGNWDNFGSKLDMHQIDAFDFDNSKPGEYLIRYDGSRLSRGSNQIDTDPVGFTVTVEPSERPAGPTARISIVDDITGKSLKQVKMTLFEDSNKNEDYDPDKDNIIAMWNTSNNPERLFTETEFDPDKRYYLGFENIPDEYDGSFTIYSHGLHFIKDNFFGFEKEGDNTEWTIRVDSDKPAFETDRKVKFRMYSRFKGRLNDFKNVGFAEIKDSSGNTAGIYSLDRDIALPDGEYSSTITVCSKDYGCFSNKTIDFKVKNGKPDKFLDYEIEKSDFGYSGNGDSNNDGSIDMSDVVLIMQSQANPDKYGANGTDPRHITDEGSLRADIDGNGVTNNDALEIQKYLLGYYDI